MSDTFVIRDSSYAQTVARLLDSPTIQALADDLADLPIKQFAHDDGSARFEFMLAANREFSARGGASTLCLHIGAVAEAVLTILANKTKK